MRENRTSGSMSGDWKQGLGYCASLRLYSTLLGIIELLCDVEPLLTPKVFRLVAKLKLMANQLDR